MPLLAIDASNFENSIDKEGQLKEYFDLALRWDAMILLRHMDTLIRGPASMLDWISWKLDHYEGIVVITALRPVQKHVERLLINITFESFDLSDERLLSVWKYYLFRMYVTSPSITRSYLVNFY